MASVHRHYMAAAAEQAMRRGDGVIGVGDLARGLALTAADRCPSAPAIRYVTPIQHRHVDVGAEVLALLRAARHGALPGASDVQLIDALVERMPIGAFDFAEVRTGTRWHEVGPGERVVVRQMLRHEPDRATRAHTFSTGATGGPRSTASLCDALDKGSPFHTWDTSIA